MPASVVANSIERFVEALVFNWLVGGTDAHAKNYSFLMEGPDIRLAPLYDLTTGLPYSKELLGARDSRIHTDRPLLRMAMSIGGESRLSRVRVSNWEAFAKQAGVDAEWIVQQIGDLSEKLPDCVRTATSELSELGVSTFLSELVDLVANHVATLNKSINEQS
jgi:serine/threonine-protein kinase HipA